MSMSTFSIGGVFRPTWCQCAVRKDAGQLVKLKTKTADTEILIAPLQPKIMKPQSIKKGVELPWKERR